MGTTSYWDYNYTGSTTGTTWTNSPLCPYTTGTSWSNTSACSTDYYITTRRILVTAPDKWSDKQNMRFIELVNIHTKTGWKVTLVIKGGDILITDPNVEKRTMAEFVPLLKDRASGEDLVKINKFFKKNKV